MSAKKKLPSWKARALYAEKMMRDQAEASPGLMEANQTLRKELEIGNNAALAQANTLEEDIKREQVLRKEFVKMTNVAQDLAEQLGKAEEKLGKAEARIEELGLEAAKNLRELDWWAEDSSHYRGHLIDIARERDPKVELEELNQELAKYKGAIKMINAQECECSENHGFIPACPHVTAMSALSFSDEDWADFAALAQDEETK